MNRTNTSARVSGEVIVAVTSGLSPVPAQQIARLARRFACTATIDNGRGGIADAHSLFELLHLGAGVGERLTIRCVGADAQAAYQGIADILVGRGAST
ncbi:MAG TPA: HPr family phosphocarrier protein [Enhygromyxa sp.]|nr:HPr family phosphocarrier protein [Enhygromyxa sp.]